MQPGMRCNIVEKSSAPMIGAGEVEIVVGADEVGRDGAREIDKAIVIDGDRIAARIVISAWHKCAAAIFEAIRLIPFLRNFSRRSRKWPGTCPVISTVSGMTLLAVPAVTLAQVSTTGSKASIRRVTMACDASPISKATGIGSTAWLRHRCVTAASLTWMVQVSAEANIVPGLPRIAPALIWGAMCNANAQVGLGIGVDQPVLDHQTGAAIALLARLEHEFDGARQLVTMPVQQVDRLRPASPYVHRGRRHACGRISRWRSRDPLSSGIGRASMSPRNRMVRPD